MKCLHICNDYLGSKVHYNLYKELNILGLEQCIFVPIRNDSQLSSQRIEKENFNFIFTKPLHKKYRYLFRLKINNLKKVILNETKINDYDLVHATTLFSDGAIAYKIFKEYRIPYIVTIRSTDIDLFLKYRPDLIFLVRNILKNATKVIFISNSLKTRFLNHFLIRYSTRFIENKSIIIYNGINETWLNNVRDKPKIHPKEILYVGRLVRRKNIIDLIESVIKLKENGFDINLNIVGSGSQKLVVSKYAEKFPDCIKYLGAITDIDDLKKIYLANQIFAMPSKGETFGLVYLEALTQGLPILFTKNDGLDGVFKFKVGESVNSIDTISISNAIKAIIKNYHNYQLNKIDFECFRWSKIAEKYEHIYKETISC